MDLIVALDPGTQKCGLAFVDSKGSVLCRYVVTPAEVWPTISRYLGDGTARVLVVGDRTGRSLLLRLIPADAEQRFEEGIVVVDEHLSSVEGRRRYLAEHPPTGIWRLVPSGLRSPAEPYDDFVAVVLAERYLDRFRGSKEGRQ